ncbi:S-layer homology domain-containing protein [Paenibacillus tarimensis]
MKKSLSLLVAIAMVFSMFASMASAATTAADAGKYLQGLGVIKGDQNGDLMEDATWKRQDLAVLISRLMGKEAEAKATAKSHTYTDVRGSYYDGFLSWAKEESLMQGHSDTRFGFDEELTYQQFATVVLRALGVDTSDYAKVPELAVEAGIVAEGLDFSAKAKRGDTYVVIVTALGTEVAGQGKTLGEILGFEDFIPEVPTISATATGVKMIEVKFDKAIDDSKAKFAVKNGQATREVTKTSYSEDKKTVVLELGTKLFQGETTVTVTGVSEADLVATFTAEDEKVAGIEFTSDKLALGTKVENSATVPDYKTASVGYKVVNQYGEDVTKTAGGSLQVLVSKPGATATANASTGIVTITIPASVNSFFQLNETVVVNSVLRLSTYGVTDTETFTIGQPASVDTVEIKGLYNADKKELFTNSTFSDFIILLEAKDQYGNKLKAADIKSGVFAIAQNPGIFTIDIKNAVDGQGENNDMIGIPLTAPANNLKFDGVNKVTITTLFGGKTATLDVEVKKAATLTTFTLGNPSEVVSSGQTVKIPFSAFDQNSNELKKFSDIGTNGSKVNITASSGTVVIKENYVTKEAYLEWTAPTVNSGNTIPVSFYSNVVGTANSSQISITVQPAGVPQSITGLKDINATLAVGAAFDIEPKHIVVKDQYDRNVTLADILNDYKVTVSAVTGDSVTLAGELNATNKKVSVSAAKAGNTRIKVELIKVADNSSVFTYENFTFNVVSLDSLTDFTVADIAKISNKPGHEVAVKVEGVRNGAKVTLPQSAYTVVPVSPMTYADGKLNASTVTGNTYAWSNNEVTLSYTVTILSGNVAPIKKDVIVSQAPLVATTLEQKDNGDLKAKDLVVTGPVANVSNLAAVLGTVKVKDQFGVEMAAVTGADFSATVISKDDGLTVNNNGQSASNVSVSGITVGKSYQVILIAKDSNVSITLRVVADAN